MLLKGRKGTSVFQPSQLHLSIPLWGYLRSFKDKCYCQLKLRSDVVNLWAVFPDIDDCSSGEHNCSHVAMCNNTIGSYNCICKEGYVGDGRNCSGKISFVMTFILYGHKRQFLHFPITVRFLPFFLASF